MNFREEGNGSSRTLCGDCCSQPGGSATGDDDVKLLHLDVAPSDGGAVVTGCRSSQFYSKRVADGNLNDLPEISPRTCAMKSQDMVEPCRKTLPFVNEEVG
jgi:hypothetical protein